MQRPKTTAQLEIQIGPIDRIVLYARNPRKNDAVVDRMCSSIREFGFKIAMLGRSDGEIVDGHLRINAARKLRITEVPVIFCDEWSSGQVKAFRLMVNRSVTWASWDDELLTSLKASTRAKSTTCSPNQKTISGPMLRRRCPRILHPLLWLCGPHRVPYGDATNAEAVARLLGDRKPLLLVTDPPYGIELDSEPARPRRPERLRPGRTQLHEEAPHGGPYRDFHQRRHASRLLRGVRIGAEPADRVRLARQRVYPRSTEWLAADRVSLSSTNNWNKGRTVLTRTHYWYQHEPCWYVRKKNAPWYGKAGENSTVWDSASPEVIMGGSDEQKFDHPTQKPVELMRRPILNHTKRGELVYDPFLGSGTRLAAAELTERVCCGLELDPKYLGLIVQRWQDLSGKRQLSRRTGARLSRSPMKGERLRERRQLGAHSGMAASSVQA
jgi:hypothetical protein